MKRKTTLDIKKLKNTSKIVCLTAYSSMQAKIIDEHADIILVGDSLGMVLYGMESTLPVTLDMMVNHGKAVVNSSRQALVVVDMPFATYQESKEQAFKNAAIILQETKCSAVKFEGGSEMSETIEFLTKRGIAVMAHIGLQPQSANVYGGYGYHGKTQEARAKIISDARSVEKAGAFCIVIEGVDESTAAEISKMVKIPTIGIGASKICDGQVLVTDDMLGLTGKNVARFVRQYANLESDISLAVKEYADDVRSGAFPSLEECYGTKGNIISMKNDSDNIYGS